MGTTVGVLGQASGLTVTTHTVYTCPAGKGAKGKIMGVVQGHASGSTIAITVNGVTIATYTLGASEFAWTSTEALLKKASTAPNGTAKADTVAPCPSEYYLDAGDTVTYTVTSNALLAANIQFVGAEVDKT